MLMTKLIRIIILFILGALTLANYIPTLDNHHIIAIMVLIVIYVMALDTYFPICKIEKSHNKS